MFMHMFPKDLFFEEENINTRIDVQHVLNIACIEWNDTERTKAQFAFHLSSITMMLPKIEDPSGSLHIDE